MIKYCLNVMLAYLVSCDLIPVALSVRIYTCISLFRRSKIRTFDICSQFKNININVL
uniref:Uncharacterized protein n=1 Tax=Octopus bimaculoides TaxID=37653 RepID=A0A0L8GXR6_OCTBM